MNVSKLISRNVNRPRPRPSYGEDGVARKNLWMVPTAIRIPRELKERMARFNKAAGFSINWSGIARDAFEEVVTKLEKNL